MDFPALCNFHTALEQTCWTRSLAATMLFRFWAQCALAICAYMPTAELRGTAGRIYFQRLQEFHLSAASTRVWRGTYCRIVVLWILFKPATVQNIEAVIRRREGLMKWKQAQFMVSMACPIEVTNIGTKLWMSKTKFRNRSPNIYIYIIIYFSRCAFF